MIAQTQTRQPSLQRRVAMLDRATAKSKEQAAVGNLPRVLRRNDRETVWSVSSRTEAGTVWLVTESRDGELACDCPAQYMCWHVVHVSRALATEISYREPVPVPHFGVNLLTIDLCARPPYRDTVVTR